MQAKWVGMNFPEQALFVMFRDRWNKDLCRRAVVYALMVAAMATTGAPPSGAELRGHGGPVRAIAVLGPDRIVTGSFDHRMIVWNVDFTRWDTDPMGGYAMLRPDGSCPACDTLGAVMRR